MSLITPNNRRGSRKGGGGRNNRENNKIYGNPLPLVFLSPDEHPRSDSSLLGLLGLSSAARAINPLCHGVLDIGTRSVWVTDPKDTMILWRRGFFGKGDLSRSEPSWLARQISAAKAGARGEMTSEQIREKRRAERAQFKLDRARAIAAAAAEAEAAFEQGRILKAEEKKTAVPSAATWRPSASSSDAMTAPPTEATDDAGADQEADDMPLEDLEHLQLTLSEAFFLIWTLDCLTIFDSSTLEPLDLKQIWLSFQHAYSPLAYVQPSPELLQIAGEDLRPDNPFLVHYVAYHRYRALGWVVKGGIKFCVDYLLYKRGPVFHHAEFAVVVIPVYEDSSDRESSPFDLQNVDPFSWAWLSTINRVNSQVHKTLILTYVTIPARARMNLTLLRSPACLAHYAVREVTVRRFIPARMRD